MNTCLKVMFGLLIISGLITVSSTAVFSQDTSASGVRLTREDDSVQGKTDVATQGYTVVKTQEGLSAPAEEKAPVSPGEQVEVPAQEKTDVTTQETTATETQEGVSATAEEKTPALSEEKAEVLTKEVSGEVASVDLEKSTLTVKHLTDEQTQAYDEVVVSVGDSTTIEKNYEKAELGDLMVGDKAMIEYTTDADGKNIASYVGTNSKDKE